MYIDKSLRRQAEALGLRITKIPESSPRFAQYGPFILADLSTNGVVASSLEAEDIAGALNQLRSDHLMADQSRQKTLICQRVSMDSDTLCAAVGKRVCTAMRTPFQGCP